MVASIVTTIAL
jgi:hypothetical protein